jgi:ABC-type branched-subunit amino acid transport system substrate-binding protein
MLSLLHRARKSLAALVSPLMPRAVAGLGLLALAACQPATAPAPQQGGSLNGPVTVALLVPSGSATPGDDILARDLENAARLAIADLGGSVQITLNVYPTAGIPAQAASAAQTAVADGARIILGPLRAEESNAAAVAVASTGVNVLSFSNNSGIAGGNLFVLGPTFENTARRLAGYAVRSGKSRLMIVHENNAAGEIGRAAIQQGAASAGASVVATAGYEYSQNGIIQAVPGIAAQVRTAGAQAVFLTADAGGALPLLTQMLSENGVNPATTQYIGLTRWDILPTVVTLPGVQGGWFTMPDPVLHEQYKARYAAAYGTDPHWLSGVAYDGIAAVAALAKRGSALDAASLTQGAGYVGVNGIFRLLPNGTNERGLAVAQIRNNAVAVVDPAPTAFGGAGF